MQLLWYGGTVVGLYLLLQWLHSCHKGPQVNRLMQLHWCAVLQLQ
jgi:hypothetical protein